MSSNCNKIVLFDRKDNIVKLSSSLANSVSKKMFIDIFNKSTFSEFYSEYYNEENNLQELFIEMNIYFNEVKSEIKQTNDNYVMLDDTIINTDINEELNESDTEKQVGLIDYLVD